MGGLVARRCVALVAVLFGLALIVFVLQAVVPENPARAMESNRTSGSVTRNVST